MFVLDRPTGTAKSCAGELRPPHLRVRPDGELLELPVGKTMVGSSPRCNLRLQQPGIQPVHCLIVRGDDGLSVRRWATDTQLNGLAFDEAPLRSGDCLALGGVELELVQEPGEAEMPPSCDQQTAEQAVEECERLLDVVEEAVDARADCEAEQRERLTVDFAPATIVEEVAPLLAVEVPEAAAVEAEFEAETDGATIEESAQPEVVPAVDAAEVVFRELQSACGVSRGRSRKLLQSLRGERGQNRELIQQLGEAAEQLVALRRQATESPAGQNNIQVELRDWEQQVQQLQGQIATLETLLADHTRQMIELQQELANSRAEARVFIKPADDAYSVRESSVTGAQVPIAPKVQIADAVDGGAEDDFVPRHEELPAEWAAPVAEESVVAISNAEPVEEHSTIEASESTFDWAASRRDAGKPWGEPAIVEEPAAVLSAESDSEPWGSPVAAASEWPSSTAIPEIDSEETVSESGWGASSSPVVAAEDVFGEQTSGDVAESSAESPFSDYSIWKKNALDDQSVDATPPVAIGQEPEAERVSVWELPAVVSAPVAAELSQVEEVSEAVAEGIVGEPWKQTEAEASVEEAAPAKPKLEQPSFIERYSHMFAEDAASEPARSELVPERAEVTTHREEVALQPPLRSEVTLPAQKVGVAAEGDEESIEQYMAKLLQRVRGDSPAVASSQAAPTTPVQIVEPMTEPVAERPQAPPAEPPTDEEIAEAAVNWDALAKRAVADSPLTDMGALRALANESARRAIGQHQIKKHRRNAVTKIIVSTLAGLTSLWLMLEAANWKDLQFIAACVSLIVAAYWAGEALRALLESRRAAEHDRPEGTGHSSYSGSLPIDVD